MLTIILGCSQHIKGAAFFKGQCEAYLTRLISKVILKNQLVDLVLIQV